MEGGQQRWAQKWLPTAGAAIGVALIATPILAIVIRGLLVWTGDSFHLSTDNFIDLLGDPRFGGAVANTFVAGVFTTALSLLLGFTLAFLVTRTDMPGRRWLGTANLLPLFLSPFAGAIAWTFLLAPHDGLLPTWARDNWEISLQWLNIYSMPGVIFVSTLFHTPFVYLFMVSPLREMDAAFEDTARAHGATFWYTMRHITLPILLPALLPAALIVFIASAGLFDVPFALGTPRGIPFIPTAFYELTQNTADFGRAAAFGVLVLIAIAALMMWQRRLLAGRRINVRGGRTYRPRLIPLRWPVRVAALIVEAAYFGGSVLVPLMALLIVSVSKQWTGRFAWRTANLTNFETLLKQSSLSRIAIDNSLILAALGATIGVTLAVLQGYYPARGNQRHRALLEIFLSLPWGTPGVVFGLGFLILTIRTPLYGTLGVILIACIARFPPFAIRDIDAMFLAVNPRLEQAARVSGADWNQIARQIAMPLSRPSLVASWLMLVVIFIRELGTTILLCTPGSETISVAMAVVGDRGPGFAAALALVQMAMLLLAFAIFSLIRAPLPQRLA